MKPVFPAAALERIRRVTKDTDQGAMIECIFRGDLEPLYLPTYVGRAALSKDGYVVCMHVAKNGMKAIKVVGTVPQIDAELIALRGEAQLTSDEYNLLTAAVAGWIVTGADPQLIKKG